MLTPGQARASQDKSHVFNNKNTVYNYIRLRYKKKSFDNAIR